MVAVGHMNMCHASRESFIIRVRITCVCRAGRARVFHASTAERPRGAGRAESLLPAAVWYIYRYDTGIWVFY